MPSKGFGQIGHRNNRKFQVPITSFQLFGQPLMGNYLSTIIQIPEINKPEEVGKIVQITHDKEWC